MYIYLRKKHKDSPAKPKSICKNTAKEANSEKTKRFLLVFILLLTPFTTHGFYRQSIQHRTTDLNSKLYITAYLTNDRLRLSDSNKKVKKHQLRAKPSLTHPNL